MAEPADQELAAARARIAHLERELARAQLAQVPPGDRDEATGRDAAWHGPLISLINRLGLQPRAVAGACTDLGKELQVDDPASSLMLASLAQWLDPRPFRRKWFGFKLYQAGLRAEALGVLRDVKAKVAFSASETRAYAALVRELAPGLPRRAMPIPEADGAAPGIDDRDVQVSYLRLDRHRPIRFSVDVRGFGAIEIQPVLTANPGGVAARSAVLDVMFRDDEGSDMAFEHTELSHSPKFPNYRYLPMESPLQLRLPEGCSTVDLALHLWRTSDRVDAELPLPVRLHIEEHRPRLKTWSAPGFVVPTPAPPPHAPVALSILDEFSDFAFAHDLNLVRPTPSDWRLLLGSTSIDFLLVESAWAGNAGAWKYALTNHDSPHSQDLKDLVAECKHRGIPTVFWNKEDPPNFDWFIDTAVHFDFIFTTDRDIIPRYKQRCGHDRVYALPFFAQPRVHNPIGKTESDRHRIAFAGTWYARKHAERSAMAPALFDAASSRGLTIFDRRSGWSKDDSYDFPERYRPHLHHGIPYSELLSAHKLFKIFLNVNSVVDSPTMFSRRVFEVLASATPVVSTASIGINEVFGALVPTITDSEEAARALDMLLQDDVHRRKVGHLGHRCVMEHHTAQHRIDFVAQTIGLSYRGYRAPKVTWAIATRRPEYLSQMVEKFRSQDYPNLELIVALNSDGFSSAEVSHAFGEDPRVRIMRFPEKMSLGSILNATIDNMTGDYWMKVDDDDLHLEKYTSDMMVPFRYTNAQAVGKRSYFSYLEDSNEMILRFPGEDHRYVNLCSGSTLAVDRSVFGTVRFADRSLGEDTTWLNDCTAAGFKIYSADIFNFVLMRRQSKSSHSWQATDTEIRQGAKKIADGLAIDLVRA